jgi:hypothetical protein
MEQSTSSSKLLPEDLWIGHCLMQSFVDWVSNLSRTPSINTMLLPNTYKFLSILIPQIVWKKARMLIRLV